VTRREWFLQLGGGVAVTGWSARDLDAAELPPGVYEGSREHLGHALAGHPVSIGGETELVQLHAAAFQPGLFTPDQYRAIVQLVALMLGESPDAPVVDEIGKWIDLTVSESAAVRAAARALSPLHRAVALHHHGGRAVRRLEEFDPQPLCHEGLAWLGAESQKLYGRGFTALGPSEQLALLKSISDDRPEPRTENAATRLFTYFKECIIDGFYTSRVGLGELGYRGNAFYASPPGCEHLFG
jgi:hypothetical protein